MWDYICPKCKKIVKQKSHKCCYCGENYGIPLRVPPKILEDAKALEDYVHKCVFPKVSQQQRGYLTQFFTILLNAGFETNDFSEFTGTVGTPTIVTTTPHHGTYCMKHSCASVNCAYVTLGSSYSNLWVRVYWQVGGLQETSGRNAGIIQLKDSLANVRLVLKYSCTSIGPPVVYRWNLTVEGAASLYTETITINTWICLEIEFDADNDKHLFYRDGTLLITNSTASAATINTVEVGTPVANNWNYNALTDCVVVADAGPIGPEVEIAAFKGWENWWYEAYPR